MAKQQSNAYWENRAAQRMLNAEKISEKHLKQILDVYENSRRILAKELRTLYKNAYKDGTFDKTVLDSLISANDVKKLQAKFKALGLDEVADNYKARITRLEALDAQILAEAKRLASVETVEQLRSHTDVINDTYYGTGYDIQKGLDGNVYSFARLPQKTLDEMLTTNWQGGNYSSRIWTNTDLLANNLSSTLSTAIASGWSIEKTSRVFAEKFNTAKYYAERLIRTETAYFENQAEKAAHEEMGVKEYMIMSALDTHCCVACQVLDSRHYPYNKAEVGTNYPPFHPNCRCTVIAYLGKKFTPTERIAVNPKTGKAYYIENMSFAEWKKTVADDFDLAVKRLQAERSAKSRHRTKSLEKTLSESAMKRINEKLKKLPTERKVFNAYKDKVMISNTAYQGTAHFSPKSQSIVFNLANDARGSIASDKYRTIMHESAHSIDFLSSNGKFMSATYKNNLFAKTLKSDCQKVLARYSSDGIKSMPSIQKRILSDLRLSGCTIKDYRYISDIFSGTTKDKIRFTYGHKADYWDDTTLAAESFAQMYSATVLNKKALGAIQKYFPESYKVYRDIIEEIGGKK